MNRSDYDHDRYAKVTRAIDRAERRLTSLHREAYAEFLDVAIAYGRGAAGVISDHTGWNEVRIGRLLRRHTMAHVADTIAAAGVDRADFVIDARFLGLGAGVRMVGFPIVLGSCGTPAGLDDACRAARHAMAVAPARPMECVGSHLALIRRQAFHRSEMSALVDRINECRGRLGMRLRGLSRESDCAVIRAVTPESMGMLLDELSRDPSLMARSDGDRTIYAYPLDRIPMHVCMEIEFAYPGTRR